MLNRFALRCIGLCLVWLAFAGLAAAQQAIYRWVDQNGNVQFGDFPPEGVEAELISTAPAPSPSPSPSPAQAPAAAPTPAAPPPAPGNQPTTVAEQLAPSVAIADMSLEELDRRCEVAREAMIAPLREAEIASCQENQRRADPGFCERFNADFGEGGRTVNGAIRPRMFDDLPECVEALEERNRRSARRTR